MALNKVMKNAGASSITQIINIVINFILPPLIIGTYGSQINGLVLTIKQILSYISLVGAGIAVAITHSLYKPIAEKDYKTASGVFNAASTMFKKAGFVFTFIALLTALIYPFFLKENLDYSLVLMLIIVMSIEGMSEFFVVGKYRSLLFADQKSYVVSLIQVVGLILSFIFAYILIKAEVNIVVVQFAYSLVFLVRLILLSWYVKNHYKYLDSHIDPIQTAVKKRNDAFIHQITGLVVLGSQAVVLSVFVGLEAASIYAVYNIVFSGLHSIFAQLINSVAPFLGKSQALGESNKLKNQFNKLEFIFNLIISFVYSVSAVMIVPFITIYVGPVSDIEYANFGVAFLFVLNSFLNSLRLPAQAIINVAGHFKETRNRAIIEATVCIILQLTLVKFLGIYGVLIGTAVALSWRSVDIILYSNKYIIMQESRISIVRGLKVVFITIILFLVSYELLEFTIVSYLDWIYWSSIHALISVAITLLINLIFDKKQTKELLTYLSKFLIRIFLKKSNS